MEKKVKGKLQLLRLTLNKTKGVLEKGNTETIQRHRETLRTIVSAVQELKIETEQEKLDNGEDLQQVETWGKETEGEIEEADTEITNLQRYLDEATTKREGEKRAKDEAIVAQQREEQLKFEKQQLEQKLSLGTTSHNSTNSEGKQRVKLPKLVITPFDGTLEKWLPFWNEFEAEIDSTNMVAVTKFAYLKELVQPKVRESIDGLPFTTEGYERAKNILKTEYGNVSEIINTYINNIMALPVIVGTKPEKIHQFYHTLTYNVQSLESLGKLKECWGMVRSVLDKLKGIKPDLVRGQVGWQSWDFPQLSQALRTWKDIHPIEVSDDKPPPRRSFQARQENIQSRACVYCDDVSHKSAKCQVVKSPRSGNGSCKLRDYVLTVLVTDTERRSVEAAQSVNTAGQNITHPYAIKKKKPKP